MSIFIVQHIDAIITTVGGLLGTFVGFRASDSSQRMKVLRILGPCVVGFGLLRFGLEGASVQGGRQVSADDGVARFAMKSASLQDWRRVSTSDGVASVEFPAAPKLEDVTQTLDGLTNSRRDWKYTYPHKNVTIGMSLSDVEKEVSNLPDTDRIASIKQLFVNQNMRLRSEGTKTIGSLEGFYLEFETADGNIRLWARCAFVGTRVYQIVAVAKKGHFNEQAIPRFLDSFRIDRP